MGDTKNLSDSEAVSKVKDLAEDIDICMFCTYSDSGIESRPMSTQTVDSDGNLWFLSDKDSNKNREIQQNNKVELFYGKGHESYLSLHGKAEISFDKEKIKDLWTPMAKVWFTEGVDDPAISVIKVHFENGHYWDTKNGKMIQLTKMAASLLTGKTMDDGIEGNLS